MANDNFMGEYCGRFVLYCNASRNVEVELVFMKVVVERCIMWAKGGMTMLWTRGYESVDISRLVVDKMTILNMLGGHSDSVCLKVSVGWEMSG